MTAETALDKLRTMCEAAAPGPWIYKDNGHDGVIYDASGEWVTGGEPSDGRIEPDDQNLPLLLAARTALPALLDLVDALGKELALTKEWPSLCDADYPDWVEQHEAATAAVDAARTKLEDVCSQLS